MKTPIYQVRRSRRWTQEELIYELRQAARRLGLTIAKPASLRVEISGWENGRHQPDVTYQLLLQDVFNLPSEALGFDSPDDQEIAETTMRALVYSNASRSNISPEVINYFTQQLKEHARLDNIAGPAFVVATSDLQLHQLEDLTSYGSVEVNRIASRFAEFTGWLLQDSGETSKALHRTERAVDLAEASDDLRLTTYNLMRKSNILTSLHERQRASTVARKAVKLAEQEAPDLLAVCLRQQALVDAYLQDEKSARDTLQRALTLTTPNMNTTNELSSYCTTSYVHMEGALCLLALRRPVEAATACLEALKQWPAGFVRDESLCLARLAVAHCELRQVDETCDAATRAIDRVRSAPSARTIHMLRVTTYKLKPFERTRSVQELTEALAEVA